MKEYPYGKMLHVEIIEMSDRGVMVKLPGESLGIGYQITPYCTICLNDLPKMKPDTFFFRWWRSHIHPERSPIQRAHQAPIGSRLTGQRISIFEACYHFWHFRWDRRLPFSGSEEIRRRDRSEFQGRKIYEIPKRNIWNLLQKDHGRPLLSSGELIN